MKIPPPEKAEYPEYYEKYISKVTGNPFTALEEGFIRFNKLISKLSKKELAFRYAEGKWTIKEILVHLIDAERVFGYRALSFARKDKTELPSFDENAWVPNSNATDRKIKSILKEYEAVRNATVELFSNFTEETMNLSGIANGKPISVKALLFIIAGHELHHIDVIKERYLKK